MTSSSCVNPGALCLAAEYGREGPAPAERSPGDAFHHDQSHPVVRDKELPPLFNAGGKDRQWEECHLEDPAESLDCLAPGRGQKLQHSPGWSWCWWTNSLHSFPNCPSNFCPANLCPLWFQVFPLNPKAMSLGELYGEYDLTTDEWADGVLSSLMRSACAGGTTLE